MNMHPATAVVVVIAILSFALPATAELPTILLTNDDGVKDLNDRALPLAEQLREFADVYVVIPWQDRSGSSHFVTVIRKGDLEVEHRRREERQGSRGLLEVIVVRGYPADCVLLGLGGLLPKRPDLVISGINGGPNLADSWLYSGTIGAARMAAHHGVPAMAVSGIDEDRIKRAIGPVTRWIAELAQTPAVLEQGPGEFLTVSLPPINPAKIVGVGVAPRDSHLSRFHFHHSGERHARELWSLTGDNVAQAEPGSDLDLVRNRQISITPMHTTASPEALLSEWRGRLTELPAWPPTD